MYIFLKKRKVYYLRSSSQIIIILMNNPIKAKQARGTCVCSNGDNPDILTYTVKIRYIHKTRIHLARKIKTLEMTRHIFIFESSDKNLTRICIHYGSK